AADRATASRNAQPVQGRPGRADRAAAQRAALDRAPPQEPRRPHRRTVGGPSAGRSATLRMVPHLLRRRFTTMDTKGRPFMRPNEASHAVIECALTVHTALGAGMLERTICACLFYELTSRGMHVQHQIH